jgi:hypothetical protein
MENISSLIGAFNDIDREFLSEHAALGLETQQLQVCRYSFVHSMINSKIF